MKICRLGYLGKIVFACVGVVLLGLSGCATDKPVEKEIGDLVWPSPPDQPRIRFLTEYKGQSDLGEKKSLKASLFGDETVGIFLEKPYAVATSPDGGLIYVTDTMKRAVVVFDIRAKEAYKLETDAMGGMTSPMEIKLDKRGRIFVADSVRQEVLVFSPEGKTLMTFGKAEGLERPTALAVDDANNRLYVADTPKHRIVVYDLQGKHLFNFGERGSEPGELNYPVSLAMGQKGNLLVTDSGNFRVQIFDMAGKFVSTFGQLGDSYGNFSRPKGIAMDSDNNIYVLDAAFSNFQIFNTEGKLLLFVGSMGRDPGTFWLPTGIYIDRGNRIYVVDSINARIQVFQYLKEKGEVIQK